MAAITVLLKRPESTDSLLTLIENGQLLLSELSLEQKQTLSNHPVTETRERAKTILERGGALPNTDRQKVLTEMMPSLQC